MSNAWGLKAAHATLHDKASDAGGIVTSPRPDDGHIRHLSVCDPHLLAL